MGYTLRMILVLTPLEIENKSLRAHLGECTRESDHEGIRVRHFGKIALATGGHGKVQFALTTQLLSRELRPRLVVCAGAGGGLSKSVNPLDIVVGETTIEHDFNLRFMQRPLPQFSGDPASLDQLRTEDWSTPVHFGTIASGDEDILETARAEAIVELTQAIAVAWEGAGGARAAQFCRVPFLEIRVITDNADGQAVQDFKRNLQKAMQNLVPLINKLSASN